MAKARHMKTRKTKPRKIAYRLHLKLSPSVWNIYTVPPEVYEDFVRTPDVVYLKKTYKNPDYTNAIELFRAIFNSEYPLSKYYSEVFPPSESKKIPIKTVYNYNKR